VERKGETWGVADKGGYPVDVGKVKELVVAVSEFRIVDEKTRNPELYSKLGVEEVTAPEATSNQVTLKDRDGQVLADVLIGNARTGRGAGGQSTLYVRRKGWEMAHEVTGRIHVDGEVSNWLDKQIAKIERKRVRQVVTIHPDGEQLAVSRETPEQENFQVQDMPEGGELQYPGVANVVGGALEWLNLEDVKPASEVDFEGQPVTTSEFTTFDGLVVSAHTAEIDEKVWMKLSARFDESLRQAPPEVPLPPALEPPEGEEAAVEGEEGAPKPETQAIGKKPEEVREEAQKLEDKLSSWAYVVPGYTASYFRKRVEDMLKQPEPELPAEDGEAEPAEIDGSEPSPPEDAQPEPEEPEPVPEPPPEPPVETPPAEPPPVTPPQTPEEQPPQYGAR
ncbi:MAG TPA: DUF4340 domain-containing protein, partial [Planctomycetota bacterium]|nr:DUF4340 domain-containing protein [Planctomycetota bacterium]